MQAQRRKKAEPTLEFDAGKVFPPGQDRGDDFKLDLESAVYRAKKGEGGDRSK